MAPVLAVVLLILTGWTAMSVVEIAATYMALACLAAGCIAVSLVCWFMYATVACRRYMKEYREQQRLWKATPGVTKQ